LTLLAALLREREREMTDTLVDLLIATVHRVGARAETKVTKELVNAFKRVSGKEHILFRVGLPVATEQERTISRRGGRQAGRGNGLFPARSPLLDALIRRWMLGGPPWARTSSRTHSPSTSDLRRSTLTGAPPTAAGCIGGR
jgi:hypothetical protein